MTDMIERMARAMIAVEHLHASPSELERVFKQYGDGYITKAVAALSALEEPSAEMIAAADAYQCELSSDETDGLSNGEQMEMFRRMIKAAKGGEG